MLRVRTVWDGVAGAPYYSNHYFDDASGPSEASAAINAVDAFWSSMAGAIAIPLVWLVEGDVAVMDPSTGDITSMISVSGNPGIATGSSDSLPPATQGLITWKTDTFIGGRRLTGRTFIPAPVEANSTSLGAPSAGYVAQLITSAAGLISASSNLAVWSRTHGVVHDVTSSTAGTKFAVLRSRRD